MSSLVGNQEEARLVHFENRLPDVFGPDYLGFTPLKDTVDPDRPVTSLDQLYVQASSLHPLLQHFVIKWASGSNGMFAYKSRAEGASSENSYVNTFESWKMAKIRFGREDSAEGVKWAKIKGPGRAFEKVLRSYGGDTSRLLDLCRQSIVFEAVSDLEQCLGMIAADTDVKILRIKNRLSEKLSGKNSCGYRDLLINLRIPTEETSALGLDTHVCEVQLILKGFAELKTLTGHRRYVQYRNTKGE
mmetsp:Transcript_31199/g.79091  ORF Transcript_31199/g.79091 Transcript_31199/m.79091 type:complete len:245 (-) Transcript_31199:196-930(-)